MLSREPTPELRDVDADGQLTALLVSSRDRGRCGRAAVGDAGEAVLIVKSEELDGSRRSLGLILTAADSFLFRALCRRYGSCLPARWSWGP